MMAEFLLEIFCEEIPARMQLRGADDLKKLLGDDLKTRGLAFSHIDTYVTPRRLVAVVKDLIKATMGTIEERRGPKVGAPEGAIQGFLKSAGVTLDSCEQRDGYYYARIETKPQQTQDVLPEIIQTIFTKLSWPKSMFWALEDGTKSQSWVRPVRSVLTVFDGHPLSFELPTLGLRTADKTQGHRFLKPDVIEVSSFADYKATLEKAFVIIDHPTRQTLIWEGLEALAHQKGLTIRPDEGLLQEVAGLVEYPVPLLGHIDAQFMALPQAVLSTSMRVHQKYFTVTDKQGKIAPYFGVIANTKGADGGTKMITGYERVLRARLSDAKFFFEQDVKIPLEDFAKKLTTIVFQAKLGTLAQKSARLKILMMSQGTTEENARAATLAKADLLASMVGEFPELQGVMGEIYATTQGEAAPVAAAIREHYQPQGPNDQCPNAPLSVALALADKLDTLVGFFGIGEEPTGSKDPFALRRAALGIIRLVRENNMLDFSLEPLCHQAIEAYQAQGVNFKENFQAESVLDFINDRLKVALRGEGIRHDGVTAVIDHEESSALINIDEFKKSSEMVFLEKYIKNRWYNICSLSMRAKTLQDFLETPDGLALSAAFRRVNGIMVAEVERDKYFYVAVDPNLFVEVPEKNLYHQLQKIIEKRNELLDNHDYTGWMAELATLRPVVDSFFNSIKVNHENEDIRANRLRLLGTLLIQMYFIGGLDKIEG